MRISPGCLGPCGAWRQAVLAPGRLASSIPGLEKTGLPGERWGESSLPGMQEKRPQLLWGRRKIAKTASKGGDAVRLGGGRGRQPASAPGEGPAPAAAWRKEWNNLISGLSKGWVCVAFWSYLTFNLPHWVVGGFEVYCKETQRSRN